MIIPGNRFDANIIDVLKSSGYIFVSKEELICFIKEKCIIVTASDGITDNLIVNNKVIALRSLIPEYHWDEDAMTFKADIPVFVSC